MDEFIKVENLRRVDVQPGDRYVLMIQGHITAEQGEYIQKAWKQFIGGDVPLLVLDGGRF